MKQNISPEELAKKMNNLYNRLDGSFLLYHGEGLPETDRLQRPAEEDFIQKTYYILRHMAFYRPMVSAVSCLHPCLTQCLDLRKIPYDLVVTTPLTLTKPENIIFRTEPEWMVRVKDKYIFNATIFSNPFDFREEYLNTPAYIISLGKNPSATPITLPSSKPDENVTTNTITATMDTATRNMILVHQKSATGLSKRFYNVQGLIHTTALDDDYRSYGGDDDVRTGMKGQCWKAMKTNYGSAKEDKERKIEYMKEALKMSMTISAATASSHWTLMAAPGANRMSYTNKFELRIWWR